MAIIRRRYDDIEDILMFILSKAFISSSELENLYITYVAKPRNKHSYYSLKHYLPKD